MEEKNKGLNINIEHYTGEKPIEVVYRLGDNQSPGKDQCFRHYLHSV